MFSDIEACDDGSIYIPIIHHHRNFSSSNLNRKAFNYSLCLVLGVAQKKPRTGRIEGRRVVKLLNDTYILHYFISSQLQHLRNHKSVPLKVFSRLQESLGYVVVKYPAKSYKVCVISSEAGR